MSEKGTVVEKGQEMEDKYTEPEEKPSIFKRGKAFVKRHLPGALTGVIVATVGSVVLSKVGLGKGAGAPSVIENVVDDLGGGTEV